MPPLIFVAMFCAQFSGLLTSGLNVETTRGFLSSEISMKREYVLWLHMPLALPPRAPPSSVVTTYSLPFSWITYSVACALALEPSPKSGSICWSHQESQLTNLSCGLGRRCATSDESRMSRPLAQRPAPVPPP